MKYILMLILVLPSHLAFAQQNHLREAESQAKTYFCSELTKLKAPTGDWNPLVAQNASEHRETDLVFKNQITVACLATPQSSYRQIANKALEVCHTKLCPHTGKSYMELTSCRQFKCGRIASLLSRTLGFESALLSPSCSNTPRRTESIEVESSS